MRTILPFLITGILCIASTLLIIRLTQPQSPNFTNSPQSHFGLVDAATKGKEAVVFVFGLSSDTATLIDSRQTGSGVLISADGYIVTNHHVIEGNDNLFIQLHDKYQFPVDLIGSDSVRDVALLKLKSIGHSFLEFGNSDSLRVGEPVLAVGSPYKLQATVTSGIISALDRALELPNKSSQNFIQTDAPINLGNSGGALLNAAGEFIGLNIAMLTTSGQYEGFSFAVPSNVVKKIVDDLKETGKVKTASIGIMIRQVNEEVAKESGLDKIYGVVVETLVPGGAADVAGIQSLDIFLKVDGKEIQSNAHFISNLALHRPGDVLTLDVLRNGKIETIPVTLQEKKE